MTKCKDFWDQTTFRTVHLWLKNEYFCSSIRLSYTYFTGSACTDQIKEKRSENDYEITFRDFSLNFTLFNSLKESHEIYRVVHQWWIIRKPLETSGNRPQRFPVDFRIFLLIKKVLTKFEKPAGNLHGRFSEVSTSFPVPSLQFMLWRISKCMNEQMQNSYEKFDAIWHIASKWEFNNIFVCDFFATFIKAKEKISSLLYNYL